MESVLVYGCMIVVAMTLFFTSMWTVHVALATARDKELATVRRDLTVAREALVRHRACETAEIVHLRAAGAECIDMAIQSDDRRASARVRGRAARRLPPEVRLRRRSRALT